MRDAIAEHCRRLERDRAAERVPYEAYGSGELLHDAQHKVRLIG